MTSELAKSEEVTPRSEGPVSATMSDDRSELAWLVGPQGERVPLVGNLSIGRSSSSGLPLDDHDHLVSRRHATIHVQGEREFWFVDLGSTNGSYVGDQRVQQPVRLRDGNTLRMGSFQFVFRQPSAPGHTTGLGDQTAPYLETVEGWLLVADVVRSSRLPRVMAQDELARQMGGWFLRSKEVVEGCGGTMNKYLGDGFLAFRRESDQGAEQARDVVKGLRAIQDSDGLPFRFVLHFGETWIGGVPSHGEESLSGPAVNFVFSAEKLAGRLGERCLVSEAAVSRLGESMELEPCGEHPVRGAEGTHRFFRPVTSASRSVFGG